MQSHQNSDWKRIKSENMRRSLIKRAKPLLVAQIIFSFSAPVPSIYSSPAGSLWSASFVETILLEFPIDWICETINAGFPPVWELLGGVRGSGLELVWDFRALYWQCFLILIFCSCVFIFLWFHFFFAFLHRPREAHICGGRGWTPPVIITRQTCHQESHYKECRALVQWKIWSTNENCYQRCQKKHTEGRSRTRDQIKIIRCTKGNHYDNQNGHKTMWSQGPIWNRFRPNYHILVRQLKIGDATGRYGKCRPSPQIRAQPPNLHLSASVSHLCIAQGGSPYLRSL